jgi:hypothetical protein
MRRSTAASTSTSSLKCTPPERSRPSFMGCPPRPVSQSGRGLGEVQGNDEAVAEGARHDGLGAQLGVLVAQAQQGIAAVVIDLLAEKVDIRPPPGAFVARQGRPHRSS